MVTRSIDSVLNQKESLASNYFESIAISISTDEKVSDQNSDIANSINKDDEENGAHTFTHLERQT